MKFLYGLLGCLLVFLPLSAHPQQDAAQFTGAVSGTVTDTDGATVEAASVTLTDDTTRQQRITLTAADGHFRFSHVAAGTLTLFVSANGLAPASQQTILLDGQLLELPPIALRVASANSNVDVTLTREEIAEEDLHVAEKQRLIGLIPNFYVVYDWHAPPLTTKQKFKLADRAIIDPANFVIIGGIAGLEQATGAFSGYGPGPAGYGKRYAAGLADFTIGAWLGGAVLPSVFRQDPRYFYKGTGTTRERTLYALSTSVIARGDNGRWQPAYAAVLGDFASGAISNLYYPASNRTGAGITITNGLLGVAFNGVGNVIQEFFLRKITPGSKAAPAVDP